MKKILSFLAVAIVATATQAATISWTSGTIKLPKGGTGADKGDFGTTTAGSGVVSAFYFLVDATAYGGFDAEKAFNDRFDANTTTGAISLKDGITASYSRTTTGGGAASWTNQTINEGQTLYVLAVYTYTDADAKAGYYIANRGYATLNVGAASADGAYTYLATNVGSWTPVSVPEPTTVALLALGLAAAGLKRKVA